MSIYANVLESRKDKKRYTGIAVDLEDRLKRHNSGRVSSTKGRGPFRYLYQEEFKSYKEARAEEKFLKSGKGREFLNKISARVVELADTPA